MNQRTLTYVLVGSIALNAFLLGVTSMHLLSPRSPFEGRGRGEANGATFEAERGPQLLRQLVRAAGGPRDPRVKELWAGHREHLRPVRRDIMASRERVLQALERNPFDRPALAEALDDALQARQRADKLANEGALQLAEKLTSEERAEFCREARAPRRGPGEKMRPAREEK